ncbi:MAG: ribosome assembly RNA-binding protein YhbY [Firmicutes bacterium HGW-Firmicutes-21]|nr:MAG: ribosome assembly RNA-binding protein YhbY [Firmicutes bacterium HGW-Firmicutes-21]
MLSTKQRAFLRSIANTTETFHQIGKNGLTENLLKTLSDALEARELIKIQILETCPDTPKDIMNTLCPALRCEPVQVIGRKVVIYRPSFDKPLIKLPVK